jgi:hypothetical protein
MSATAAENRRNWLWDCPFCYIKRPKNQGDSTPKITIEGDKIFNISA